MTTAPSPTESPAPADPPSRHRSLRAERTELLEHLEHLLEPIMIALGLLFLAMVALEYSGIALDPVDQDALNHGETLIYWIFVGDFGLRFLIAPDKLGFLRLNWITALSLVLPLLRPLRVLRVGGALPPIQFVQTASGMNRGLRALRQITHGRQFTYLVILTTLVTLLGAGGVLYLDHKVPGANITTARDALWWAATLITTINSDFDPVSGEGRIVGFLMRLYAVSVLGYITASIARYLIGRPLAGTGANPAPSAPAAADPDARLAAIEDELAALRQELAARTSAVSPSGVEAAADAADKPSTG